MPSQDWDFLFSFPCPCLAFVWVGVCGGLVNDVIIQVSSYVQLLCSVQEVVHHLCLTVCPLLILLRSLNLEGRVLYTCPILG